MEDRVMEESITRHIEGFKCEGGVDAQGREFLLLDRKQVLNIIWGMGESLIVLSPEANIWFVNRATEKMLGWGVEELIGRPLIEFAPDSDQELYESLREMTVKGPIRDYITDYLGKDGERVPVSLNCSALRDNVTGIFLGMVVVARDMRDVLRLIDELEDAKEDLEVKVKERTGELENVALLAAGLVHDFNNFLTSIAGNITLAKQMIKPKDKIFQRLDLAELATYRAAELTKQLLTIAKSGSPLKRKVSVGELVREEATLVLSGMGKSGETLVPDDLWPVEVDKGQIAQVLDNLFANAGQATPEGGIISAQCANVTIEDEGQAGLTAGRYVKVTVKDEGVGIDGENLQRIFDPYFTTKKSGSGLGLATCYSIIKKHGGLITVESEPGVGTSFDIYLPALIDGDVENGDAQNVLHDQGIKYLPVSMEVIGEDRTKAIKQ